MSGERKLDPIERIVDVNHLYFGDDTEVTDDQGHDLSPSANPDSPPLVETVDNP